MGKQVFQFASSNETALNVSKFTLLGRISSSREKWSQMGESGLLFETKTVQSGLASQSCERPHLLGLPTLFVLAMRSREEKKSSLNSRRQKLASGICLHRHWLLGSQLLRSSSEQCQRTQSSKARIKASNLTSSDFKLLSGEEVSRVLHCYLFK